MAMVQPDLAAAQELCARLVEFKKRCKLSYEKLGELASCSKGTAENYIAKPGHGRGQGILDSLLTALDVTDSEREEALRLYRLSQPCRPDPGAAGWAAAAAAAHCTVWELEEFTPAEATVHPAIRRGRVLPGDPNSIPSPPSYVLRDHDALLRADIGAAARGELSAMIVLRGGPSTGKTRSLFEAVHALGPGWTVIRPRSAAALRALAASDLLDRRRCVLWLNELQVFLGPDGAGLTLDVLRDLFGATGYRNGATSRSLQPLVIVATLWQEKLRDATAPEDHFSDNRNLLVSANQWVRWHDIPRDFSPRERDQAREVAENTGDDRLGAALDDPDRIGFAQTLAGGHEILQHYLTAPTRMDQLLLDAAGDARRLGHASPMPAPLLRAIATALWREERGQASLPPDSFETAFAYATQPLRSTQGVQALIPIDSDYDADIEDAAYELADYLEQHLSRARITRSATEVVWNALREHTTSPDDLHNVARAALNRGHIQYGEALLRAAGTGEALEELARWLAGQSGREQEAEQAYRDAIPIGHRYVLGGFVMWLEGQPGRAGDIEKILQDVIADGHPSAPIELARWLERQPGREEEAGQSYREAAADGHPFARAAFAGWLAQQPGRVKQAEKEYRALVADGYPFALVLLAGSLERQPGRAGEVEKAYRAAGLQGRRMFADWLSRQPGRAGEAEEEFWALLADSNEAPFTLDWFVRWLEKQPGRENDIEKAHRAAAAAGDAHALCKLAQRLSRQPGREGEAEKEYRAAIAAGDTSARRELAHWLGKQPGREKEAEEEYQGCVADGGAWTFHDYAEWLRSQPGREKEAEKEYRNAIAAGYYRARRDFAEWLRSQPGREKEAEQIAYFGPDY
ncbi:hypothetical protein [Amycolatopsis sp. VC5-11]|uniref:hypothetical protein n=1 Tax=Amycolatopsis sp. VC5-11 TaxID=3120156 RepID=UPI003009E242